jgi:RimJ/RimL family protein N-acetyltransferase
MPVYLRALESEDYLLINKWRNDPEITRLLGGNFFYVSPEREKKSLENKIFDDTKNIYLGVCLFENKQLIGYVHINNLDLRNLKAEWGGTLIGEKEQLGKGYGKKASQLLLRFLFDQYPINKCYAYCLTDHPITPKLFKTLGFRKEGLLRKEIYKNGEFKDLFLYSILRDEINGCF